MKVLLATEKPFAKTAVEGIRKIVEEAGHEFLLLEKYTEKSQLLEAVKCANAIIIRSDKIDAEVMDAAPELKIVVRAGAGYDNVDLEAATAHGIVVMNTPGQNANAVAELVFAMLLFTKRNRLDGTSGTELLGKTIGILAYGNVGRNVARIAKGFGMNVIAYDAFLKEADVPLTENQEALFEQADIVSLHIPATPETKNSIGGCLVKKMKKGGILVNTARKEVIDEPCLLEALKERTDLSYATDLQPSMHEAYTEALGNRYLATPKKMGAQTSEANVNAGLAAARQIADFFATGCTRFQVNK